VTTTVQPVEISQAEREAAAYSAYLAAGRRGDHVERERLWQVYSDIHAQRSPEFVEQLERAKGLR
jgi:hypothetical protein